jgi:hypothetical protein
MEEAEAYCPPGLPLPTVAHDRGHGIASLRVYCAAGLVCANWKDFTLEELQLSDGMVMIHIPRHRRFVCTRCGSQKVTIRSKWPQRKPTGPAGKRKMKNRWLTLDRR